ncbi:TlpA disulfide reductase family protein [Pedobacter sp. JY14-1]|uniref:TlpA family protein disulfide reductase n=1 Tax=Pedobacter sp. JY14-1 TaxID=3034151 RepID=UPI0023E215D4|nr:TlpA disulfide reductase family protein [Pedobacter sp. JY14-1]
MNRLIHIFVFFIAFAVLISSCRQNPVKGKPGTVSDISALPDDTVTIRIDGTPGKERSSSVFFYYHDSLSQTHGITLKTETTKFKISGPVLFLESTEKQTPFLIYPGETVNIKNLGTDSLRFYAKGNPERTNELDFFRQVVQKTGNMWYFYPSMYYQRRVKDVAQLKIVETTIDSLKNVRLNYLKTYTLNYPVSNAFADFAKHCIATTALRDSLLLYHNNRAMISEKTSYSNLAKSKIRNLSSLGFKDYAIFHRACIDLVSIAVGTTKFDIDGIGKNDQDFIRCFDFIEKNFDGQIRDFLLAHLLYSGKKNRLTIPKYHLDQFDSLLVNRWYFNKVHTILQENHIAESFKKGSNKLLSLNGKRVQDLKDVFSKHRGKLMILDFWASWCSPCRMEMPYIAKLKEHYQGKNVVFISISTDSEVGGWKKAAKEEGLNGEENYLLLNADDASFVKKYNISSIPRYILIGKSGEVLVDNTPRPSEQGLMDLIDKHL